MRSPADYAVAAQPPSMSVPDLAAILTIVLGLAVVAAGAARLAGTAAMERDRLRLGVESGRWRAIGGFEIVTGIVLCVGAAVPLLGLVMAALAVLILIRDLLEQRRRGERMAAPVVGLTVVATAIVVLRLLEYG